MKHETKIAAQIPDWKYPPVDFGPMCGLKLPEKKCLEQDLARSITHNK